MFGFFESKMSTDFQARYNRQNFLSFLGGFLPSSFVEYNTSREISIEQRYRKITKVNKLGECSDLDDLVVLEIEHESDNDPRVTLTREAFQIMKSRGYQNVLAVFIVKGAKNYRFSLMTFDVGIKKGRVTKEYSNPRRYSFFLGEGARVNTPKKYLKDRIIDFVDLKSRFSVEVVTKVFYEKVADYFRKLVSNDRNEGFADFCLPETAHLDSKIAKAKKQEFVVRLLGRLIFCWFLTKKKTESDSEEGKPLIPTEILSLQAVQDNSDYYHQVLEPLFFRTLNTEQGEGRDGAFSKQELQEVSEKIPFLNGGLFEPHKEDHYKHKDTFVVPDKFFKDLFELFETYNFTIDESSSSDIEISIDPEMLGMIFENLLGEVSPDKKTADSAKTNSGSFYTPREIVAYMVDQILKKYLKDKTTLSKEQLEVLFSFEETTLGANEKDEVVNALNDLKIIDPACGSGAFPMGILQRMVSILEKINPASRNYTRKLGIIQKSVYGVDILPLAVEISRLRFFLSLIVDEKAYSNKYNLGIEALPNLSFKFVSADSLKRLPKKDGTFGESGEEEISELKKLHEKYFTTSQKDKKENLKKEFKTIQNKMSSHAKEWQVEHNQTTILSEWDPFVNKPAPFFDPEWMFGITKFDIAIANPPYGLKVDTEIKNRYDLESKDSYGVFIASLVEDFLKEGGIMSFIVSDTFMTIKSHKPLRKLLLTKELHSFIRLHSDAFNATVNACVFFLKNDKPKEDNRLIAADLTNISTRTEISELREKLYSLEDFVGDSTPKYAVYQYPQELIKTNSSCPIFVGSPKLFALMNDTTCEIEERAISGKPVDVRNIQLNEKIIELVRFGDIAEVKQGLATGDNDYYLFQNPEARGSYKSIEDYKEFLLRPEEIEKITNNEELRKKVIERGFHKSEDEDNFDEDLWFGGRYILPYDKGGASELKNGWLPNYYVKTDYFIDWSQCSVNRMKTLTVFDRDNEGSNSKICSRFQNSDYYFKKGLTFSWTGMYSPTFRIATIAPFDHGSSDIFCDVLNDEFTLAILCSKISKFISRNTINHTVNFGIDDVKEIIFPISKQNEVINIVIKIMNKQKQSPRYDFIGNEQKKVDHLVYEAYGLNKNDIREIETWYARKYPKLARYCYTTEIQEQVKVETLFLEFMIEFKQKTDSEKKAFIHLKTDKELDLVFEGLDLYREGQTISVESDEVKETDIRDFITLAKE